MTTMTIFNLNLETCEKKESKFSLDLSNVVDKLYFERGIAYKMYKAHLETLGDNARKINDALKNMEEKSPEYIASKLKYDNLMAFRRDLMDEHGAYNFTEPEKIDFDNDTFMSLVASVLFKTTVDVGNVKDVMAALSNYEDVAYNGAFDKARQEKFKALKEAINKVALCFATTETSGHYKNSRQNANATMTEQVWQKYYAGCRTDKKTGQFINTKRASAKQIQSEIIAQFVGKLQGSISITDVEPEPEKSVEAEPEGTVEAEPEKSVA